MGFTVTRVFRLSYRILWISVLLMFLVATKIRSVCTRRSCLLPGILAMSEREKLLIETPDKRNREQARSFGGFQFTGLSTH